MDKLTSSISIEAVDRWQHCSWMCWGLRREPWVHAGEMTSQIIGTNKKKESILKEIQTIQVKWCEMNSFIYFSCIWYLHSQVFQFFFSGNFQRLENLRRCWLPWMRRAQACYARRQATVFFSALGMGRILELMVDSIYNRTGKVCLVHEISWNHQNYCRYPVHLALVVTSWNLVRVWSE